jgi:Ca2+-transporting ATPase
MEGVDEVPLDDERRRRVEAASNDLAAQGYRVLALAVGVAPIAGAEAVESGLTLVGLAGISDPPREGVKAAIQACGDAGIRVVMITGDAKPTAAAIAADAGLTGDAMLGRELDVLSDAELVETVERVNVFARAEPRHKVLILEALQQAGNVVVMTGDGVNDAPALKAADVGIAMGIRGTEVARDASDMVLLDDSFPTIVAAVEEGRRIFANIKKFVSYLLIGNFAEVVVILIAGAFGYLPVTAVQILWINLITDSGPAVALGIDPAHSGLMREPPQKGRLIGRSMLALLTGTGFVMAAVILGTFAIGLALWDLETAQTMTFTAFVVQEYLRLAIIRYQERTSLFVNRWLTIAVAGSLLMQVGILYGPVQSWFGVTPLGLGPWGIILGGLVIVFGLAIVVTNVVVARFGRP